MSIRTALLLTGFQNDFCHPDGALGTTGRDLTSIREMLPAAARLLGAARAAGIVVLHVAELTLADGLSDSKAWTRRREGTGGTRLAAVEDSWGQQFLKEFQPLPDELEAIRYRPSCMSDARTEVLLRSAGVRRLVVAGVETHLSVVSTVIEAAGRDYDVVVPTDCVAGTLPDLHRAALGLLPAWCELASSTHLLQEWAKPSSGDNA